MFPSHTPGQSPDFKNLILALVLCTAIMAAWQYFYERPRMAALKQQQAAELQRIEATAKAPMVDTRVEPVAVTAPVESPRLPLRSDALHGTINLEGGRFDDLTLAKYRVTIAKDSPEVRLLGARGTQAPYFVEFGLLPEDASVNVPDAKTLWQSGGRGLTVDHPVTLRYENAEGIRYEKIIAMDKNYMFTVTLRVINNSGTAATFYPYGLIQRTYADDSKHMLILYEGPIAVMNGALEEISYESLREDGPQKFEQQSGWIGISDKYWLTAIIPESGTVFDANFRHLKHGEDDGYQVDLRSDSFTVAAGAEHSTTLRFFAGAKQVRLLDTYSHTYHIPLFDRAVDFGNLYFLTKPMFQILSFFHSLVGNFGIAIMLLTILVKLVMFPLANKSYTAMSQMKLLTPKMKELQERFKDDKLKMQQEIMAMYKREKVNPMSGCLPILVQIPVFFALYKVLYVTIEMRHAPFFGWIQDLSAPDPTSIFNFFGLFPWDVPHFLMIGVWPLIMCLTMVIQQRLNPKPTDEIQAAVITYMPYVFLFLFASFPAGLVIYWAWNNTLTIAQQWVIQRRLEHKGLI
ncbi:MAG: membrane protein insertase YidC [Rickettsiales bacterium]|jgi:YidC/Oxa1 family membrane protein insertase|nr:membrane protein insertase YidC [Rickettsiales bacterium]